MSPWRKNDGGKTSRTTDKTDRPRTPDARHWKHVVVCIDRLNSPQKTVSVQILVKPLNFQVHESVRKKRKTTPPSTGFYKGNGHSIPSILKGYFTSRSTFSPQRLGNSQSDERPFLPNPFFSGDDRKRPDRGWIDEGKRDTLEGKRDFLGPVEDPCVSDRSGKINKKCPKGPEVPGRPEGPRGP